MNGPLSHILSYDDICNTDISLGIDIIDYFQPGISNSNVCHGWRITIFQHIRLLTTCAKNDTPLKLIWVSKF